MTLGVPYGSNKDYVDLMVRGTLITGMKIMETQYKGRCLNSGKWFQPQAKIAFKHRDKLNFQQRQAIFGNETVYNVTVLLDSVPAKSSFTPSRYQQNILNNVLSGNKHIFIKGLPGCGKTATLIWLYLEILRRNLPLGRNVLFMAYNTAIKEELAFKLQGQRCLVLTTHGYGFQLLRQHFSGLQGDKVVQNAKTGRILDTITETTPEFAGLGDCRKIILALVGFIKNWAIIPQEKRFSSDQKSRIKSFIDIYQLTVPGEIKEEEILERRKDLIVECACAVVIDSIPNINDNLKSISWDDMLYLPLALNLSFGKYDLVFTDETQDFNAAQELFLFNLMGRGARITCVGDDNQAIYRFRGADSNSFTHIRNTLGNSPSGVVECDLPINYRSDEEIISYAQQWLPKLEGRGEALGQKKGEVTEDAYTFDDMLAAVNNDGKEEFALLCRINAPLVITAYKLMALGKRSCIIGKQLVATPLINLVEELCGKPNKKGKLPENYTNRLNDLKNAYGEVIEEGFLTRLNNYYSVQSAILADEKHYMALDELTGNVECLEVIVGNVKENTVDALLNEIADLFTDSFDDKTVIKLSTVHRAKGLEWDCVFVLRPDLMPHPAAMANPDGSWSEEQQQERNIEVVCSTRAKHKLHYVPDWPFGKKKSIAGRRMIDRVVRAGQIENKVEKVAKPESVSVFVDDGEPF